MCCPSHFPHTNHGKANAWFDASVSLRDKAVTQAVIYDGQELQLLDQHHVKISSPS